MSKKPGKGESILRPRKPARAAALVDDYFPATMFFKRGITSNDFTPAVMVDIDLLAASGATWADIAYVGIRAHEMGLMQAAKIYIDAGHGGWFAIRYTRFVRLPARESVKWQALYVGRPAREISDPANFVELRRRLVLADLERDTLPERYGMSWPGQREAHLEALTPITFPAVVRAPELVAA